MVGDFNLPCINWYGDPYNRNYNSLTMMSVDVFFSLDLSQWAYTATLFRSGYIYLLFISSDDRVGEVVVVLSPLPCCEHCLIVFSCVFRSLVNHKMYWRELGLGVGI